MSSISHQKIEGGGEEGEGEGDDNMENRSTHIGEWMRESTRESKNVNFHRTTVQ